jgi:hypothetical protein
MQCAPPSSVAGLDVERREREHVGLELAGFEEHVRMDDLLSIRGIHTDESEEAALLLRQDSPASPSPADALARLEESRNRHMSVLCSASRGPGADAPSGTRFPSTTGIMRGKSMLFEHSDAPRGVGAGASASGPEVAELSVEERGLLLRGLHDVDTGRPVDVLAVHLLHRWGELTADERASGLSVIGALLAGGLSTSC